MILSNMTVPLLGLVNTAVMGHLDKAYYIGAVGVGAMIFDFLYWGFGFLRMGTTGLVAQSFGRRNFKELRTILGQGFILALLISFFLIVLQEPIEHIAFKLVHADPTVTHYAKEYFAYRIWAAPATLCTYVIVGWFIGIHKTKVPLLIMLVTNLLGIILDIVLVFGFHMTANGVALATVIAVYVGCFIGLLCVWQTLRKHKARWHWHALLSKRKLIKLINLNKNIFLRTLFLIFAFSFFTRESAQYGAIVLAANVVLMNFQNVMAFALDGFANAAEAMIGRAVALKDKFEFLQALTSTGAWSIGIAVFFVLLYLLAGHWFVYSLTSITEVRLVAEHYRFWVVILPLLSVWGFWFDGVFIGATLSKQMRNAMGLALAAFLIVYFASHKVLGNDGLWLSFCMFMLARGVFMACCLAIEYRRERLL